MNILIHLPAYCRFVGFPETWLIVALSGAGGGLIGAPVAGHPRVY
ncbi:MAG: hypothetical protein WBP29_15205 [Candidatus Zixiibacteriota bacterium]